MEGRTLAVNFDYLRAERQMSSRRRILVRRSFPWFTRPTLLALPAILSGFLAALPLAAQYVGPSSSASKPAPELRAVAVLEWTGDADHPKAGRLVPVSVFDGQQLQDAGIYLARPQPLALDSEVEYQLQRDGKTVGLFDVQNAGQQQGSWVGFGTWKPLPSAQPRRSYPESARSRRNTPLIADNGGDSSRPVLHRRTDSGDTSGSAAGTGNSASAPTAQAPPPDSDRPTLHRADTSNTAGSGTANPGAAGDAGTTNTGTSSEPPPDPDRPTLHRGTGEDNTAGNTPADDPDRPKLNKQKPADEQAYVSSLPNTSDPDRPHLGRGIPAGEGLTVEPTLVGLPPEMNQEVAVSDAVSTTDHPWDYSWANPQDEATMKSSLEDIARKDLGLVPPPPPAAPAPRHTSSHGNAKPTPPAAPPPPAPLLPHLRLRRHHGLLRAHRRLRR
jgi:hypothetical protein